MRPVRLYPHDCGAECAGLAGRLLPQAAMGAAQPGSCALLPVALHPGACQPVRGGWCCDRPEVRAPMQAATRGVAQPRAACGGQVLALFHSLCHLWRCALEHRPGLHDQREVCKRPPCAHLQTKHHTPGIFLCLWGSAFLAGATGCCLPCSWGSAKALLACQILCSGPTLPELTAVRLLQQRCLRDMLRPAQTRSGTAKLPCGTPSILACKAPQEQLWLAGVRCAPTPLPPVWWGWALGCCGPAPCGTKTQRLWHAVINVRLRRRVRTFQACSIAGTRPCPPVAVQVLIRRAWISCPSQLGCSDLPTIIARCPCKYEKVLALHEPCLTLAVHRARLLHWIMECRFTGCSACKPA